MISLPVDEAEIAYSDRGTGTPVVLVHAGALRSWFLPVSENRVFDDAFRVVHTRRAGYGHRQPARHLTMADHAGHLARLADHLQIDGACWVGHSSSCQILLQLALDRPALVRALVLIEPAAGGAFAVPASETLGRRFIGPAMAAAGAGDLDTAFDLFMRGVCGDGFRTVLEQRLGANGIEEAVRSSAFFFRSEGRAVLESTLSAADAARIRCPILVAEGANGVDEGPLSGQITARAVELLPQSEVVLVAGTNHMMPLQDPDAVARMIREFAARHVPAMSDGQLVRHWIDGAWRSSNAIGESRSPSTGDVIGRFANGGATEAHAAIRAARRAFDTTSWSRDRDRRGRALFELADRLDARRDALALAIAREEGKLLGEAAWEVGASPGMLRHAAAMVLARSGGRAAEVAPGVYFHSLTEPVGVAGLIVPWNAPVALLVRSLAPALAAGCTVAVKLPAQTAQTNGLLCEVFAATTGLPKGVVNLFTETGDDGAAALVASADVDAISYTGSIRVGRIIAAEAARTLKRVNLELGGKTPMIVFKDADLDHVLPLLVRSATLMAGHFCMAASRVLVQRAIAEHVRAWLIAAFERVKVGPSDDPSSEMGPLVDRTHVARVDRIVDDASTYAKVLVRGGPITEGPLARGAFYRPALIEVDDLRAPVIQQEVFGPVQTFEIFDDEADAIRRANATEHGLAAAVFTRDVDRARRVGRELEAGTVWTNTWAYMHDQFEEGGFRQSGIGRLRGEQGIAAFEETKTYVQIAPPPPSPRTGTDGSPPKNA